MRPLTEKTIRSSFLNASQRERNSLTLPADFDTTDWDNLDFFGWRDSKLPAVGYVFGEFDGGPAGIMVRQVESKLRSRPQCSWCEDVTLPNDVVYFSAKRAGAAGRNGNTVGTLVCANFECSANVRTRPPLPYAGFDFDAAQQRRVAALAENYRNFANKIRDGE
ncbi:translation elongation factor [Arthrobacter sp. ERGS1:01]|uniref:FBP domain-containing protein n=1 Tax=Arthrobacter sp. ERGS1:01 TaxID=1704044 RepID=UPI0006B542E7|nr:FBP domain-containing protein [Arthrobacter sp. ERGS1:01]ALE05841.1 translation elongation factor [Arthrobacter sp. ERGS1:01]